ncbi:hypothetical protein A3750_08500 [Oleiphilus sp. HI0079]|uniref:hypothetical protein n=1 Tax=Oleiphilus sp. HI0079 TaxID=1822254 RepID=UPI0007C22636|nr:hypothetical protein [Oleiphilus sp. HI0079]KZZ09852.1 hypothetical protein A3750_08500 [Oleiphilus sp. HI0079]
MMVSDELVFLELHKTGGTHIGRLMEKYLGGHREGKHNRLPAEYKSRFVFGSVRNPWDWYVSLWAYGCLGKGSVHQQTTSRISPLYYYRELNKEMGHDSFELKYAARQCVNDVFVKDRAAWEWCYEDANDPEKFRTWLQLVLNPENSLDLREGYGFAKISKQHGLMTYRLFKLFTSFDLFSLENAAVANLDNAWKDERIVDYVIRNEELEKGFVAALDKANYGLSDEHRSEILGGANKRTNVSKRGEKEVYYDETSINLVASRESFIVDTFGYHF